MRFLGMFFVLLFCLFSVGPAFARSNVTPWASGYDYKMLVYGSTTPWDVQQIIGEPPDEIIRSETMYPLIENHYYYDKNGSGTATVFVFENNFLMGMHLKSADNQWIDLSYFLANKGDAFLNSGYRADYLYYYPYFPFANPLNF